LNNNRIHNSNFEQRISAAPSIKTFQRPTGKQLDTAKNYKNSVNSCIFGKHRGHSISSNPVYGEESKAKNLENPRRFLSKIEESAFIFLL